MLVKGLEGTKFAIESGGLLCALNAHINADGGLGGNHIGARSALDHARIYRQACSQIIQFGDARNLPRQLKDRAVSFAGIEACMCGDAFDAQRVFADALARSLDGTAESSGGLEDQHSGGLSGQRLGDFTGRPAADFFIGNQKNRDRPGKSAVPGLQRRNGVEHKRDARLHIENARTEQSAIFNFAWHIHQSAQRIDRVIVAQQQDWFALGRRKAIAVEVDLQTVAEIGTAMEASSSAEGFELLRQNGGNSVDRWLVVAGRFDFYQRPDGLDNLVLTLFEVAQPVRPYAGRDNGRSCSFLTRHDSPLLTQVYCAAGNTTRYSIIFRLFERIHD